MLKFILAVMSNLLSLMAIMHDNILLSIYWLFVEAYWVINYLEGKK